MDLAARIIHEIDNSPLKRDLSGEEWLSNPLNIFLVHDDDLALFDYLAPGTYAIHLFFKSRGREAIEQVKDMTQTMFKGLGAHMLVGIVPAFRRDVAYVAAQAGWKYAGNEETPFGPVRVYLAAPEMH